MTIRFVFVLALLAFTSCGGSERPGFEPTDIVKRDWGKGFWCVERSCFRTQDACKSIRSRLGRPEPCERESRAVCFEGYDRDNMLSYTACLRDLGRCEIARKDYMEKFEYMELSRCVSTR